MIQKIVIWLPRILSILLVILLFMLSFDVFEINDAWYMIVFGFLIHNIPSIVLTVALIIAWKHPLFGSVIYISLGSAYSIFMLSRFGLDMISTVLTIGLPSIMIGILFLLSKKHLIA